MDEGPFEERLNVTERNVGIVRILSSAFYTPRVLQERSSSSFMSNRAACKASKVFPDDDALGQLQRALLVAMNLRTTWRDPRRRVWLDCAAPVHLKPQVHGEHSGKERYGQDDRQNDDPQVYLEP